MNKEQNTTFTIIVDDFGTKHNSLNNLHYLTNDLKAKHATTVDMTGNTCINVTLNWSCNKREVTFSISDFFPSLLRKANHQLLAKPQCSPFPIPHATNVKHAQL